MMVANFQEHCYVAWQIPRYYSGYSVATSLSKTYLMEGGASRRSMRSIRKIAFASRGLTHVFRVGRLNSLSLRNVPPTSRRVATRHRYQVSYQEPSGSLLFID